jgi:hypothetical protein
VGESTFKYRAIVSVGGWDPQGYQKIANKKTSKSIESIDQLNQSINQQQK